MPSVDGSESGTAKTVSTRAAVSMEVDISNYHNALYEDTNEDRTKKWVQETPKGDVIIPDDELDQRLAALRGEAVPSVSNTSKSPSNSQPSSPTTPVAQELATSTATGSTAELCNMPTPSSMDHAGSTTTMNTQELLDHTLDSGSSRLPTPNDNAVTGTFRHVEL